MSSLSTRDRAVCAALAAALIALAAGGLRLRRDFIRAFFGLGAGRAAPPALAMPAAPSPAGRGAPAGQTAGMDRVDRVRVVLIDGASLDAMRAMTHLGAICGGGYDIVVDTGFPTVSLPVQHALWTGLTQQQSGILFRGERDVRAHPLPPPAYGIPAQVAGSVAVTELHPYIIGAFGFARAIPPDGDDLPTGWPGQPPDGPFMRAARDAVASDAPLVFVHVLRVDVAGHKHGAASLEYARAVRDADDILGALYLADVTRPGPRARWFVLSDHGHRPGGGHGGAEPAIRQVRGCIAGALPAPARPAGGYLHMVDMARAIADSTGVSLPRASAGRPLHAALRAPVDRDATLPSPPAAQWLIAAVALVVALAVTAAAGRGAPGHPARHGLPWWWAVALISIAVLGARVTMSEPMIYQGRGQLVYLAAWPGLVVLAVAGFGATRRLGPIRAVLGQLALPAGALIAALALAGGLHVVWGGAGEPPLMPVWTAQASVLGMVTAAGAFTLGLVLAGLAVIGAPPEE